MVKYGFIEISLTNNSLPNPTSSRNALFYFNRSMTNMSCLQSIYVTRDHVILKFEARVQIYMAVLNICCEIQNSGRNVVRFSKINSYEISFWLVLY